MSFQGIGISFAKKPYIFVIFKCVCVCGGGGGGSGPPVLPSGSAHDMPHIGTACVNNIVTDPPVTGRGV